MLDSPALAFAVLLVPLVLVPAGLIALRIALAVWYGGGVEAFDRRYEERVAERIGLAETRADAFELLVARWRPQPLWQRELLHTSGAPEDLCNAEYDTIEDGRAMFAIICISIEPYAAKAEIPLDHRDLAEDARDRALWLTARMLRMSAAWLSELPVVVVHQQQQLAPDDVVVYRAAFEPLGRMPALDALLAELGDRVKVVENTAQGRRRPIAFR
jgi:hypothetical protein